MRSKFVVAFGIVLFVLVLLTVTMLIITSQSPAKTQEHLTGSPQLKKQDEAEHRPDATYSGENKTEWKAYAARVFPTGSFQTVILDCLANNTANETADNLGRWLTTTKRTIEATGVDVEVWLKHPQCKTFHDILFGNTTCLEAARLANKISPGTIQGIVIADSFLWEFRTKASLLAHAVPEKEAWEIFKNHTLVAWKRDGLQTGLLIEDSQRCVNLAKQIPSQILEGFNRTFFLERAPDCNASDNETATSCFSGSYNACKDSMRNGIALELVIPEKTKTD